MSDDNNITIRTGPVIKIGIGVVVGLIGTMVYQTYSVGRYVQRQETRLETTEKSLSSLEVRVSVAEKIQGQGENRIIILEEHDRTQAGSIQESRASSIEQGKAISNAFAMLQTQLSAMDATVRAQMADFNAKLSFLVDKSRGRSDVEPPPAPLPFDRAAVR